MSYLPGVPDMGPKPVQPTVMRPAIAGRPSTHIAMRAASVGKPGNTEDLGSVVGRTGKGISSVGGGNVLAHSLNHYGKNPPPGIPGMPGGIDPTAHPGTKMIRGGLGKLDTHIREGGLGPGRQSTPGASDTDYSMQSEDTE